MEIDVDPRGEIRTDARRLSSISGRSLRRIHPFKAILGSGDWCGRPGNSSAVFRSGDNPGRSGRGGVRVWIVAVISEFRI